MISFWLWIRSNTSIRNNLSTLNRYYPLGITPLPNKRLHVKEITIIRRLRSPTHHPLNHITFCSVVRSWHCTYSNCCSRRVLKGHGNLPVDLAIIYYRYTEVNFCFSRAVENFPWLSVT